MSLLFCAYVRCSLTIMQDFAQYVEHLRNVLLYNMTETCACFNDEECEYWNTHLLYIQQNIIIRLLDLNFFKNFLLKNLTKFNTHIP